MGLLLSYQIQFQLNHKQTLKMLEESSANERFPTVDEQKLRYFIGMTKKLLVFYWYDKEVVSILLV
jgi:hypothetical protein